MTATRGIPLTEVTPGNFIYIIDRIDETDPQTRRKMLTLGIVPGRPIRVETVVGWFGKKYVVYIEHSKYALNSREAGNIYVRTQ